MGSIPTVSDVSSVHVIFQRHAESVAELPPNFNYPPLESLEDLENIVEKRRETVRTAIFLPDGLTESGVRTCLDFAKDVPGKIDNVYLLASSPLTRAVETMQAISPSFQLVGPFHAPQGEPPLDPRMPELEKTIYVHPGLMEASTRPSDIPGTPTIRENAPSRQSVTFLRLKGGIEEDALTILDEEEVDITRVVWPEDVENRWQMDTDRTNAVTDIPDLASIEQSVREARIWLREWAAKVLSIHQAEGIQGTPRIVVCTHGGILNFITQEWRTALEQRLADGRWELRSPTVLDHLSTTIWTFESATDGDAMLKELPQTEAGYYTRILGQYYHYLSDDESQLYLNPDGSVVDQRALHFKSLQDISAEVREFGEKWWTTLEILTNWTGLENSQVEEDSLDWDQD
ncbi:hypothetical protein QBC41DRAFT_346519 [Cercophora samala]|uniref:Uncharacterized protein n=1 Tax=Cercophora samala TaxID=330535 RepID=A0AA40DCT6_9PEZI|nr:hypothetical protein QBC41DRAFT_346519 [Cercophora samala]